MIITVTTFKSVKSSKPLKQNEMSVDKFIDFAKAKRHTLQPKTSAQLFNLASYKKQGSRKAENIDALSGIILDIDEVKGGMASIDAAISKLNPAYCCWVYSTSRHTQAKPKVRIVVPLSKAVTPSDYENQQLAMRLAAYLGLTADEVSSYPTQVYYFPSTPNGDTDIINVVGESRNLFDVKVLPEIAAAPSSNKSGKANLKENYKLVDEFIENVLEGIRPLFINDILYVYVEGIWVTNKNDKPLRRLFAEYYDCQYNLNEIEAIVQTFLTMCAVDEFPKSADHKISLKNCVYNTETEQVEEHSPENYHRVLMDYDYDENAICPIWEQVLEDLFISDEDKEQKKTFLSDWFGYLLTPRTDFQVMTLLYGDGSNGKSVVNSAARLLLGDENVSAIPLARLNDRFMSAAHEGKLANIVDEISSAAVMDEGNIKCVVSGDRLQVEKKGKDPHSFIPTARIMAATNEIPRYKDGSKGFSRRIIILTFNREFAETESNRNLVQDLRDERTGMFQWALRGCKRLRGFKRFPRPPSSDIAHKNMVDDSNSAASFVRDCVEIPDPSSFTQPKILANDLYILFCTYCKANGGKKMGSPKFGQRLRQSKVEAFKSNGDRYYRVSTKNLADFGVTAKAIEYTKTELNDAIAH